MDEWEREELLIRMDERIKTIYNRMDKFETLFTNHLSHHEMWENDMKTSVHRWLAAIVAAAVPSAADIDAAMVHGYRHPIGPLRLTDLVGLDVRLAIAQYLHEKLGSSQFEPPKLLQEMVSDGLLGKKSGKGFYCWKE